MSNTQTPQTRQIAHLLKQVEMENTQKGKISKTHILFIYVCECTEFLQLHKKFRNTVIAKIEELLQGEKLTDNDRRSFRHYKREVIKCEVINKVNKVKYEVIKCKDSNIFSIITDEERTKIATAADVGMVRISPGIYKFSNPICQRCDGNFKVDTGYGECRERFLVDGQCPVCDTNDYPEYFEQYC